MQIGNCTPTTVTYSSSAQDYLRDLVDAESCADESRCDRFVWGRVDEPSDRISALSGESARARPAGTPVHSLVVRSFSATDHFDALGREPNVLTTRLAYHDGYYEGVEQEFRGFGASDSTVVGDWNNPTAHTRARFHQGRRRGAIADDRLANNPDESLKGREWISESFDDAGRFESTDVATFTVRHLLTGLDGRDIGFAFVSEQNELRYDTTPFAADPGPPLVLPGIVPEQVDSTGAVVSSGATLPHYVRVRGDRGHAARIRTAFEQVDNHGHVGREVDHGRIALDGTPLDGAIETIAHHQLVDDGGLGRWIWRATGGYARDLPDGPPLGLAEERFDAVGDRVAAIEHIALARPGTFPGETAAEGGAAAVTQASTEEVVASVRLDPWGQPTAVCGGGHLPPGVGAFDAAAPPISCLRFSTIERDARFADVVITERISVAPGGEEALTLGVRWDRGIGGIVGFRDPRGADSTVVYDGMGRIVAVLPPAGRGCAGDQPSTRIRYELTTDASTRPVSRVVTVQELDCDGELGEAGGSLTSIGFVDGMGRSRATLTTGDDEHAWVREGVVTFDAKGTERRAYQPDFFDGDPADAAAAVALPVSTPYTVSRYDAFGRLRGAIAEDGATTWTSHHALSVDVCDPLDNAPESEHYHTCSTTRSDGHGRVIDTIVRNVHPGTGAREVYRLFAWYRADGAATDVVRAMLDDATVRPPLPPSAAPYPFVRRRFHYDSAGRRVGSDDPDTDDPNSSDEASNGWRYVFNPVGDLVAVRDPRGCGQNFFYDRAGRILGEQYVSCGEAQAAVVEGPGEEVPSQSVGGGLLPSALRVDVRYHYDDYPLWLFDDSDAVLPADAGSAVGLPTGITDRAQRAAVAYDARGDAVWTARQVAYISDALPLALASPGARPVVPEGGGTSGTVVYDASHTYVRTARLDNAGRTEAISLPRDPDFDATGGTPSPLIGGTLRYGRRGLPEHAEIVIDCDPVRAPSSCAAATRQTIVEDVEYLRDGLVARIEWGDRRDRSGRLRPATVSESAYDLRRRPIRSSTRRHPTADAADRTLGAVSLPFDQELVWDNASNLTDIVDHRNPREWPAGNRPRSIHIRHDSLYRVVGAEFEYTHDTGARSVLDDASDWREAQDDVRRAGADPMEQRPAPMVPLEPAGRAVSMVWTWDWLSNVVEWDDDTHSFHERSLGEVTNGYEIGARPTALYLATNLPTSPGTALADLPDPSGSGWVEVDYGVGGNLTAMTVHGQCDDAAGAQCWDDTSLLHDARRAQLRASCACAVEQHYDYRWDEVNRLAEARRWDRGPGGVWRNVVRQRYRYDSGNQRIVKQTIDRGQDPEPPGAEREQVALYVFAGDFERRGLVRSAAMTYAAELGAETQYLVAGARVVWRDDHLDPTRARNRRVTVPLTDAIGSTAAVLDLASGELVESTTFYPNGATETYLVDDEGPGGLVAREPAGFTGHEADEEVGVVYAGHRYLVSRLGRWATPDPLHIHAMGGGEALNSYHYVSGNVLAARDPIGLDPGDDEEFVPLRHANGDGTVSYLWREHGAWVAVEEGSDQQQAWDRALTDWYADHARARLTLEGVLGLLAQLPGMSAGELGELGANIAARIMLPGSAFWFAVYGAVDGLRAIADDVRAAFDLSDPVEAGLAQGALEARALLVVYSLAGGVASGQITTELFRGFTLRVGGMLRAGSRFCRTNCFVAGTLILTATGLVPIEDVQVGDMVLSQSEDGSDLEWAPVADLIRNDAREVVDVTIAAADGTVDTVGVTAEHPFFSERAGWTEVRHLTPGDRVQAVDAEWVEIVALLARDRPEPVFNLEVAGLHTYFVTDLGIWAHNCARARAAGARLRARGHVGPDGRLPALREYDIDRYGSFSAGARRGDGLAGHEGLQNAWLEARGYSPGRGEGAASRGNPALALSGPMHDRVSAQQARMGLHDPAILRTMSAEENIRLNGEAMRLAGIPEHVVRALTAAATEHARAIGAIPMLAPE